MYKSPIEISREQIKTEYDRQQYVKGYNNAIDDFKIRFFCELNNRVVRPIFSKQIQSQFTIDDIKSIFDEIVEQLKQVRRNDTTKAIEQFKERLAIPDYREQMPEYYEAMEKQIPKRTI